MVRFAPGRRSTCSSDQPLGIGCRSFPQVMPCTAPQTCGSRAPALRGSPAVNDGDHVAPGLTSPGSRARQAPGHAASQPLRAAGRAVAGAGRRRSVRCGLSWQMRAWPWARWSRAVAAGSVTAYSRRSTSGGVISRAGGSELAGSRRNPSPVSDDTPCASVSCPDRADVGDQSAVSQQRSGSVVTRSEESVTQETPRMESARPI